MDAMFNVVDPLFVKEYFCPKCYACMEPPIQRCYRGHSFCNQCSLRHALCPICSGPKGKGTQVFLEGLYTLVSLPCKNKQRGCTFTGQHVLRKIHEKTCPFFSIACPLDSSLRPCFWLGSRSQLHGHFMTRHGNIIKDGYKKLIHRRFKTCTISQDVCLELGLYTSQTFKTVIRFDRKLFLVKVNVCPTGYIQWCLEFISTDEERGKEYQYKIEIGSLPDKTAKYERICGTIVNMDYDDACDHCDDEGNLAYKFNISECPQSVV